MKLRLTVVYEYDTGDEDKTLQDYETTDPAECARIDEEAIGMAGDVSTWLYLTDIPGPVSYRIEPVNE